MIEWLISSDGIASIIQIFVLIVLILTFLNAHRPHVGVIKVDSSYNEASKDFTVLIKIKNTGNIPANNVSSNMRMFINSKALTSNEGKSKFVLFPSQETSGSPVFHGVEKAHLVASEFKIIVDILYQQPISSFLPIPVTIRKYKTTQELLYDPVCGKFATTSGSAT